ncbi:VWA domain-containing protein, partial [Singulisphaera rosea]
SPEPARDLELTELMVDEVVFVDDLVRFQAKLLSRGFAGQEAVIHLKERDKASSDPNATREIEAIRVPAPVDGQPKRIEIAHRPKKTGDVTYLLEVEPRPRELQVDNNRLERTVNVRKEKLKVLLVDGEPRYEYRYLKNYLEREETIDLNVVLLSSDPEYNEQDRYALPTFPAAKDDLFHYDVVLLGDADPSFLSASQMQNLAAFVTEKGGGILFLAGENFNPLGYKATPLEMLLPIELGDARNPTAVGTSVNAFRPELTAEGRSSPIFRFG